MVKSNLKSLLTAITLSLSLSSIPSHAKDNFDDVLIKIDVSPSDICTSDICLEIYSWTITALDDDLIIKNITFNRGRCDINTPNGGRGENKKLQYSDTWTFNSSTDAVYRKCKPLEAKVETNKGSWNFNFK